MQPDSITYTLNKLNEIAQQLIEAAGKERIWLFDAQMGAGKTTLIKALAQQLGVEDTVSSPTFGIVNEYLDEEGQEVYHFDCYRLKDEEEALDIGIEEYFDSGAYCWIEWPSQIEGLWPETYFSVEIEILSEEKRKISYKIVEGEL